MIGPYFIMATPAGLKQARYFKALRFSKVTHLPAGTAPFHKEVTHP